MKERKDQDEEELCKSIIKGLARLSREKHAMLAEIEEEQPVIRIDDVNGKELPWHEVRKQELKYVRIDTNKAFEESSCKSSDHELLQESPKARESKSGDRPDLYGGTLPWEALKAFTQNAANHKDTFSIMHIDVHTFMQKLRDLYWYDYQWRTEWAPTLGELVC